VCCGAAQYLALYATLYATVGNLLRPARIARARTFAAALAQTTTFVAVEKK
jgi:hypothetical protein